MGSFLAKGRLEGNALYIVSSKDPGIDWEASGFTRAEFMKDREALTPKLRGDFVKVYFHFPTDSEIVAAYGRAGFTSRKDGSFEGPQEAGVDSEIAELISTSRLFDELARYCIDGCENYEDFPEASIKVKDMLGLSRLKEAIEQLYFPNEIGLLTELGGYIFTHSAVTKEEKKPSGSSHTGLTPEKSSSTPTSAVALEDAAKTLSSESTGGVTAQANAPGSMESDSSTT